MNESFPSSGGAEWPQFEAPTEERQENMENIEQPDTTPAQELGRRALESVDFTGSVEEEQSSEASVENVPIVDTVESLAERQEKLKKASRSLLAVHHTLENRYLLRL